MFVSAFNLKINLNILYRQASTIKTIKDLKLQINTAFNLMKSTNSLPNKVKFAQLQITSKQQSYNMSSEQYTSGTHNL